MKTSGENVLTSGACELAPEGLRPPPGLDYMQQYRCVAKRSEDDTQKRFEETALEARGEARRNIETTSTAAKANPAELL